MYEQYQYHIVHFCNPTYSSTYIRNCFECNECQHIKIYIYRRNCSIKGKKGDIFFKKQKKTVEMRTFWTKYYADRNK